MRMEKFVIRTFALYWFQRNAFGIIRSMTTLKECPVCTNQTPTLFLKCNDYLVSGENFSIVCCNSCGFRFTNPIPAEKDLGKYYASEEYISHSNTAKGLINSIYKLIRNYTLVKKRKLIGPSQLPQGGCNEERQLLDIGCGTGEFLGICKKSGWSAIGVEPGIAARKYAEEKHGLFIYPTIDSIEKNSDHFDVITMWHVLEHVPDLNETIILLKQLLKKDGTLLVALPNCDSLDARIYQQYWAAYDVPRHLYHFTPKDVKALFNKHGMQVQRILPMWFDSFYIAMLSEKHKFGKTNYLRAIYNGLVSNLKAIKTGQTFSSQIYLIKHL